MLGTWQRLDHSAELPERFTSLHIFCTSSSLPAAATSVLLQTMPLFLLTLMAAVTCSSQIEVPAYKLTWNLKMKERQSRPSGAA